MTNKLTVKEEAWVQDVFIGMTYTQAYRNNYDTSNSTDKSVWELASRQGAKVKLISRLIELQEEAAERSQVTVESITRELEEARILAQQEAQTSSMVGASMGKAKVNGLLVEKVDTSLTVIVRADDADL